MCKITKSVMQPLYGVLFTFIHLPFLLGVKERSTRSLDDPFFHLHAFIARYTCRGDYRVRSANKVQKIVNKWTFVRAIRETALITKQPPSYPRRDSRSYSSYISVVNLKMVQDRC